jgi:hypothetical protein
MALLSGLLGALGLDQLFDLVLKKFPAIGQLFDLGKKIVEHFTGVFQAGVDLFNSAQAEFEAWKHFKEDIRFRQRVIQVERALAKAQEFFTAIVTAWKEILSLIKSAGVKLETGGAAEIAEAATGIGLPIAIVNAIVIVVEVLDTVRNLIDTAQNIVTVITDLRELLEGDLIFLQQRNPRQRVALAGGGSIKIRVGGIHQSS